MSGRLSPTYGVQDRSAKVEHVGLQIAGGDAQQRYGQPRSDMQNGIARTVGGGGADDLGGGVRDAVLDLDRIGK
jgi:hypothetical protein